MASKSKFEKLIEYVVADNETAARKLFHQIVVNKSRKIYEGFTDMEQNFDSVDADQTDSFSQEGEEEVVDRGDMGDDLESDVFADDEFEDGSEEELNPDTDTRLTDLENEFDELQAEFEKLANGDVEEHEEASEFEDEAAEGDEEIESDIEDIDFDNDDSDFSDENAEEGEEDAEEADEEEPAEEEEEPVDEAVIREYVEKVTQGLAKDSEESFVQKKSPVAGKNEIVKGVNAKNIAQAGSESTRPAPKSGKFTDGMKEKIKNVPGADSGVKSLKGVKAPTTTKEAPKTNTKSVEA